MKLFIHPKESLYQIWCFDPPLNNQTMRNQITIENLLSSRLEPTTLKNLLNILSRTSQKLYSQFSPIMLRIFPLHD